MIKILPPPILAILTLAVLIAAINALPKETAVFVIKEGSIVESLSAIAWFISALIIAVKKRFALMLLPLFCGMRELDLHKAWTSDSILKSRYLLGDAADSGEKIIAICVLLIFITAFIYVCVSYRKQFFTDLLSMKSWAVRISFSILLLFISKIFLDGMERKLHSIGIDISSPFIVTIIEECMELVAAMLVAIVSVLWAAKTRAPKK